MSDRQPIIAGNWKMHKDHLEAIQLVQRLAYLLDERDYEGQDVVVCPPFTALRPIQTLIDAEHLPIGLGAQNCHWESEGAWTGEISPKMLARLDVDYVICGHSERRQHFVETDEVVNHKVRAVFAAQMTPILCVGETLDEREQGQAEQVVVSQLTDSLADVTAGQAETLVVAYEPIWAIGTGKTASAADAQEMCATVRATLGDLFGGEVADGIRVQYGGSVKPGNVKQLMGQPDIDGALVGGASLNSDDFGLIVGHRR